MAMSVQTNIGALSAQRYINTNQNDMNNSISRLSSGFRINKASDDSAGYAIASKLSAQNSRLMAASQNALQATAMVQMADASINEIQNMVTRLQALATQAASSNNQTELTKLDAERSKLVTQINNIANSTNFNGKKLLDGSGNGNALSTVSFAFTEGASTIDVSGASAGTFSVTLTDSGGGTTAFGAGDTITVSNGTTSQAITLAGATPTGTNTQTLDFSNLGIKLTINSTISGQAAGTGTVVGSFTVTASTNAATFQVGADNAATNQVSVDLSKSYTATGLAGTNTNTLADSFSSTAAAQTYIDTAKQAMDALTTNRASLGAAQNQLSYVNASLSTNIEQVSSAVSTIKDADMAMEMANFTKSQILVQTGTAMLAQANKASQNVLSLFR